MHSISFALAGERPRDLGAHFRVMVDTCPYLSCSSWRETQTLELVEQTQTLVSEWWGVGVDASRDWE